MLAVHLFNPGGTLRGSPVSAFNPNNEGVNTTFPFDNYIDFPLLSRYLIGKFFRLCDNSIRGCQLLLDKVNELLKGICSFRHLLILLHICPVAAKLVVGSGMPHAARHALSVTARRAALGSAADSILRSANCPLLVVHGTGVPQQFPGVSCSHPAP